MTESAFKTAGASQIAHAALTYCGADTSNDTWPLVLKECMLLLYEQFGVLSVQEVGEAFALAGARKITLENGKVPEMTAYAGVFTVKIFGDVMAAYCIHRNKILAAIQEVEQQAELDEQARRRAEHADSYRTQVIELFQRLQQENTMIRSAMDVHVTWPTILKNAGLIEGDKEMWIATKNDVAEAFIHDQQTNPLRSDLMVGTSDVCRNLVRLMKDDPDYFPPQLMMRAEQLYGRRMVFKYLAPYTGDDQIFSH